MEKYGDHLATLEHFAVIEGHLDDFLVTIGGSYLFLVSSI